MTPTRRAGAYIAEAALGVGLAYFVLGGSEWPPFTWAVFCVFTASVTIVHVLHHVGHLTTTEFERFRDGWAMLAFLTLFAAAIWHGSLALLGFTLLLGLLWLDDQRVARKIQQNQKH